MLAMREINVELMEREAYLEEYNPYDRGLKARLPDLGLICAAMGEGGRDPFPDLTALYQKMDLQEVWEPTFPPVTRRR